MTQQGTCKVTDSIADVLRHYPSEEIEESVKKRCNIKAVINLSGIEDETFLSYVSEHFPGFTSGGYFVWLNNDEGFVTLSISDIEKLFP